MPTLPPAGVKIGGVDAHQTTIQIHQRTARIARVDGSVGLYEVFVPFDTQAAAPESADDATGHGLVEPKRVADGHDKVAHPQTARIGKTDLDKFIGVNFQYRQIHLGIAANHGRVQQPAVRQGHVDVVGTLHNMIVGDDISPIRIHHHTAAGAARLPVTLPVRHVEEATEERVFEQGVSDRHGCGCGDVDHRRVDAVEHGRERRHVLPARQFQGQRRTGGHGGGCRHEYGCQQATQHLFFPIFYDWRNGAIPICATGPAALAGSKQPPTFIGQRDTHVFCNGCRPCVRGNPPDLERETGLEPATTCLGSKGSTN